MEADDSTCVKVAVRIRPQLPREKIDNCRICTSVTPGEPQVVLGNDKAFTFDKVFDIGTSQQIVFSEYAQGLIDGCLDGYNATILAYGQTGSGKTHSMGTGFDINTTEEQVGIIPRAVAHLFDGIQRLKQHSHDNSLPEPTFQVLAQFMELYNEDIYDLFDPSSVPQEGGKKSKSNIKIHEDANGSIYTQGVASKQVLSYDETMECLRAGALSRTTASTNMNSQSSRSHAIFTLLIKQTKSTLQTLGGEPKEVDTASGAVEDFETLTAKFNFVDLAGSERLKRTGATGDRAKEGISINCGLLALGNVISALGDATKKGSHVPYRDSKLTRLLQDSLGGNSRTVMIACISPSDRDFMETLNTLKYANRAKNIKNRVVVNQDKTSKQLTELRAHIQSLQLELAEYKQGKRIVGPDGVESINDMFHENSLLQVENDKLRLRVKALQETVDSLTSRNASLANDRAAVILSGLTGDNMNEEVQKLIAGYTAEMESMRTKLLESEANMHTMSKTPRTPSRLNTAMSSSGMSSSLSTGVSTPVSMSVDNTMSIIELAKRDVEKSRRALMSRQSSTMGPENDEESSSKDDKGVDSGIASGGGVDSGGGSGGDDDSGEHDDADLDAASEDEQTDEEGEEDDIAAEDELSSDSDESDRESDHLQEDLAELSGEISLKQRMIEELEKSQRQLQNIRQHYEDKLRNLQDQIQAIERERDQVLNSLGSKKQQSDEQVKKVKSEYEKKLNVMQSELSKVNAAKREHAKMMKNQAVYDKRIKDLSVELNEMKKIKVRLMAQMKTDSEKNKLSDQKKSKELIQLRKEKRLRENQVKMLELQNRQKDAILKRKHEEVSLLRKKQRENSASSRVLAKNRVNSSQHGGASNTTSSNNRVANNKTGANKKPTVRTPVGTTRSNATPFSPKAAKSKWDKLEHYISSVVMRKQTISHMEAEMDLHINKREELSKKIENYSKRFDEAINKDQNEIAMDLEDQLESMMANMNYIQSNVTECQNCIMQMEEEAKEESTLSTVLNTTSLEESKYLMEHLLSLALSRGFDCTQKEAQYKELCARYEKMQLDSKLRDQLLEQVLQDSGITIQYDGNDENGSRDSSCRSSPLSGDLMSNSEDQLWADMSGKFGGKSRKARRRTATTQELLMGMSDSDSNPASNTASPTSGKPSINIADILPPAPKGPPPGRGLGPPPIDTILEEEETEATSIAVDSQREDDSSVLLRSGSYTVLNSTVGDKPDIVNGRIQGNAETSESTISSSGSSSPDNELNLLDNRKLLAGSYTILNGEITLDNLPTSQDIGDAGQRVPPKVTTKPTRPGGLGVSAGPISGSLGMNKWKGVVSSHLDDVQAVSPLNETKSADTKTPQNTGQPSTEQLRDSTGRVIGRRKLAPGSSPSIRRKTFQPSSKADMKEAKATPPSSPTTGKRRPVTADSSGTTADVMSSSTSSMNSSSSNVFMRLTGGATTQTKTKKTSTPGTITACEKIMSPGQTMVCTKRAVGHTKAVLSVCATEDLMISGSKDLTCKVWDLSLGAELMSLEGHPNYVTRVRYCDINKLVYTVSNSFVKIWDIRSGAKCVKVLSSSGLVHDSIPIEPASSSQAILQQGEQQIFDIRLSSDGQTLYTTTGTTVRVWDLRMYSAIGKVASGHQAPIICLSIHNSKNGGENLITGSKDHLIKLFDLSSEQTNNCLIQPKFTLEPPHYDGVQCLAHRGNVLFSGSRDMCIKKWDLNEPTLQPLSLNAAHKDWITDMSMLPDNDVLVSCCRSGLVKLWSSDSCNQIDEVKAHTSAVNCLAINSKNVFTASSDHTVKIWSVDSQRLASSS